MFRLAHGIFLVLHLTILIVAERPIAGYYWRDFEGILPKDAYPAGLDRSGLPMYIGQVLYDGKIVPGKIYGHEKQIRFPWDNEKTDTFNIKILCTRQPEKFKWIPTKHDGVTQLTNTFLVKGGFEPRYSTYLGRAFDSGETIVGKVICTDTDCLGLHTPLDGEQVAYRNAFEVLTYKT